MKFPFGLALLRVSLCAVSLTLCSAVLGQPSATSPVMSPKPPVLAAEFTDAVLLSAPAAVTPQIPPAVLTMVTLGNAGLLQSTFSLERLSLVLTRVGESRASIGYANATGIRAGYRDYDRALVLPLGVTKSVPLGDAGVGFVRFAVSGALADADPHQLQWNDGSVLRVDAQFLYAPIPSRLFGIGLIYQDTKINNNYTPSAQVGSSDRVAWGGRIDYAEKLSPYLGVTIRGQVTSGNYDVRIPAVRFRHTQNVNEYYAQAELVGTVSTADLSIIPTGWVLHPSAGANVFYGQFERTADSFGIASGSVIGSNERYGTLWGDLRLEKAAALTPAAQILPYVGIGLEREYVNNLEVLVKEPNYGRVSAGFAFTVLGQRIDVAYNYRYGLSSSRSTQDLIIATSLNF